MKWVKAIVSYTEYHEKNKQMRRIIFSHVDYTAEENKLIEMLKDYVKKEKIALPPWYFFKMLASMKGCVLRWSNVDYCKRVHVGGFNPEEIKEVKNKILATS